MKILFFSTYFYPYISGLTVYPLILLKHLQSNHCVTVLTFKYSDILSDREKKWKIKIYRLPYLIRFSKGFLSPQSLIPFFQHVRTHDVVILNVPNFEGLFLAILARMFRKSIISIFHCQVNLSENVFSKVIVFFLNTSVFLQLLLSDNIVAYPEYVERIRFYKYLKRKIIFSFPPILPPHVSKKRYLTFLKKKNKKVWIGYVGRIAREKGLEYLIDAVKILQEKSIFVRLMIVGPSGNDVVGEEKYERYIKQLLTDKKIAHDFLGKLPDNALGAFYKSIDILVLPSINKTEAFGMVQVEAMYAGTPVVASNLPGIRLSIKKTGMGILVPPKNSKKLAIAIMTLLRSRRKYKRDENTIRNIFSINKTINIYENILKQHVY